MRLDICFRWVGVAAFVLGVSGSATAQPAPAPPVPPPSGQVGFERSPKLSLQEESAQGETIISRIDQATSTVRRQLDSARQGRDVIRSLCLSDKLSQVDVASRSARDRQGALQAAVQRGDTELANHEMTILTVLRQRAEQLTAEANQCLGEEVAFVGQTQVITQVDPNLPSGDTTFYPPTDPTLVSAPPQCTSCTH